MRIRKMLPMMMVILALAVSSSAFAAEEAPVMSKDQFLTTLQDQTGDTAEALPELEGTETPALKHGSCFFYGYVCRGCTLPNGSRGLRFCQSDRCLLDGTHHYHYYNCGACTTACST